MKIIRAARVIGFGLGLWFPCILFGIDSGSGSDSLLFGKIEIRSERAADVQIKHISAEFSELPANVKNYTELSQSVLKIPQQQGYYFPAIQLESVNPQVNNERLQLNPVFRLNWGEMTRIDTIMFAGIQKTRPVVLRRIVAPFSGLHYTPQIDREIRRSLQRFSFLSVNQNSEIVQTRGGRTGILLNVSEMLENEFTGVAGYVPETYNSKGYFTGELDLKFHNLSGTGRQLFLYWSKTSRYSQEIRFNYTEPWIWKTNLFGTLGFEQVLRDTLVVIRNVNLGVGYYSMKFGRIALSLKRETTIPTPGGRNLLGLVNTRTSAAGLNYSIDRRDNMYNPLKGYLFHTGFASGIQNRDSLANTFRSDINLNLDLFFPLRRQLVLVTKFNAKAKWLSAAELAYSDQFWFGGAGTLRGYPDDFFRGSRIAWGTLELRRLIGNLSSFFVFFDQGYYWRAEDNITISDSPYGYGFGVRLASRMGIIGLDYGFGEGDTFSTAKVHIRLISRF